jgi:two-component system phosphate regulon response regulator OmpR
VSTEARRILVIDDDPSYRTLLQSFLTQHGLSVVTRPDGGRIVETVIRERIDLVLLDLMLPGEDGLALCKRLRAGAVNVPVIMVTAKGDTVDRIVGLQMGADDYVPKPFDPRELLARIDAVLRRSPGRTQLPDSGAPVAVRPLYCFGPFELDTARHTLIRSGNVIILKEGEFAVLQALVTHPRQPLSRARLGMLSRQSDSIGRHSMDSQIARLRRLIEEDAANPCYIRTVRGFGYVFSPEGPGS